MNEIVKDNPGNIFYVPHPMEYLYQNKLPAEITIIASQYPIELLLIGSGIKTIAGFNSSVLYNAAVMELCNDIRSYMFSQPDYIQGYNSEANSRLCQAFVLAGIKIINP